MLLLELKDRHDFKNTLLKLYVLVSINPIFLAELKLSSPFLMTCSTMNFAHCARFDSTLV